LAADGNIYDLLQAYLKAILLPLRKWASGCLVMDVYLVYFLELF